MAIDFPNSPTSGDSYTVGDKSWQWDGAKWIVDGAFISPSILKVDQANSRVGIGTSTPQKTLHIEQSDSGVTPGGSHHVVFESSADNGLLIASGTTSNGRMRFGDSDSAVVGGFDYDHADDSLKIRTAGTDHVIINSSGNVGIDTTAPTNLLHTDGRYGTGGVLVRDGHVSSASPWLEVRGQRNDANDRAAFAGKLLLTRWLSGGMLTENGYLGGLYFGANTLDSDEDSIAFTAGILGRAESDWTSGSSYPTELVFRTGSAAIDADSTSAEPGSVRMLISSAGDVGIGTTSPTLKFQVNGTAGFNGSIQTGQSSFTREPWSSQTIAIGNLGYIGTEGAYRLSLAWNWERGTDSGYHSLGVNSYTSAAAVELGNDGIIFCMDSSYGATAAPTEVGRFDANGHFEVGGSTQPGTDAVMYTEGVVSSYNATTSTTAVLIKAYSNVGGTQSLKFDVRSDGDVNYDGVLTDTSDVRLKTDIADTDLGLGFIEALRPVSYRRTSGTRRHYGFIAQEVAEVLGDDATNSAIWVERRDLEEGESSIENPQGLRYNHLIAPLVKAVQELSARIETLETA